MSDVGHVLYQQYEDVYIIDIRSLTHRLSKHWLFMY